MKKSIIRKKQLALIVLLIFFLLFLNTTFASYYAEVIIGRERQGLTLHVYVIDENSTPVSNAQVKLYMLTENGAQTLSTSMSDENGYTRIHVIIPRKYVTDDKETGKPIYASINLMISAAKNNMLGVKVFPVDPTHINWPEDQREITIMLKKSRANNVASEVTKIQSESLGCSINEPNEQRYVFTKVLMFTTWNNITAYYNYPAGAKIRIESKKCECFDPYGTPLDCSDPNNWISAGYTEITLDRLLTTSKIFTDRYMYTLYFEFLYEKVLFWGDFIILSPYYLLYAADTSTDPRDYSLSSATWDGQLPNSNTYYITHQGDTSGIPISGGDNWVFSVSVGISVSNGGASVGVSLGVSKVPAPQAFLYISAGKWYEGYSVKTVSPDGGFLKAYSGWVYTSPKPLIP